MNAVWFIGERFTEISTILGYIYFLHRSLSTRATDRQRILLSICFGAAILITYHIVPQTLKPYVALLLLIGYSTLVYEDLRRICTLWCVYAIVIDGVADATVVLGYELLLGLGSTAIKIPGWHRIAVILLSKTVLFFAYLAMTVQAQHVDRLSWRNFALLLCVPIGSWVLLEALFRYNASPRLTQVDVWLPFAGGVALMGATIANATLFHRILAQEQELASADIQLRVTELTRDHIERMNAAYDRISRLHHDLNNHIEAISGLYRAGNYEAIGEYIRPFLANELTQSASYVGHAVLDVLIGSRMTAAQKMGIDFEYEISLPDPMPLSDVDLCIVVSNLLDNAFEAVKRLGEGDARYIHIHAQPVGEYWVVACRNATVERGAGHFTGSMRSTKRDAGVHGIGTRQIRDIAERAGGYATYVHKEYVFSAVVMVRLKEAQIHIEGVG